ncbi:putative DNA helicase [Pontibacter ummariensis]|uniref:DNA helicase, putative n=1 Tax=Pontibacter ummariensis TaxID=1610492 RepID=A0A239BPV5_9BACT|nr:AAA domain-containing protein [Pontibacter ummariensis]PRY15692.1 putative DNA helicase [Pontibacter ummariensis]SNS09916.1 DNA helicase, putative [Pontibacter ummariensis]
MSEILYELKQVEELLKIEQEEDRQQYKIKSLKSTIAERKEMGFCWYPVTITKEELGFGNKVVVELERTKDRDQLHLFQVGKTAALFSNNGERQSLNGVIVGLKRNKVQLATNKEDLPDWIDDGRLGIDLTFDEMSYREMEIAMKKVTEAYKSRLAELRDIILGDMKPRFTDAQLEDIPSLNPSQNEAVRKIVQAKDVAIIHGPPGTGKTTTLVQAILRTLETQRRLLVTAPSNTAVDLLTEKLANVGVNVIRIGNPSRVSDVLLEHTLDAQIMEHRSYKNLKDYRKTAEEYKRLAFQYKRKFGPEERAQRQLFKAESKRLLDEADRIEEYITEDLLNNVQVITCTLVGAANKAIRHLEYDTAFIDEAAQALEPACWIPITRAKRVVLAGDHCQLPPTVKSFEAEKGGLSRTLFEKCIERQPEVAVMLKTQYRMHHEIMEFSNQQFYKGELHAHESVHSSDLYSYKDIFAPGLAVEFVDTAGCGYNEVETPESQSSANPDEANLLLNHLTQLLKDYSHEEEGTEPLRIGVIAPYRAQINYLQDRVEHLPLLHELKQKRHLSVGTVDSFQGQERDIIYISMTRSNESGEIGFLADIRRMNVAMTRAKKKLVIVGDSATLSQNPFYAAFLTYVESIGAYRSAWELTECMP